MVWNLTEEQLLYCRGKQRHNPCRNRDNCDLVNRCSLHHLRCFFLATISYCVNTRLKVPFFCIFINKPCPKLPKKPMNDAPLFLKQLIT